MNEQTQRLLRDVAGELAGVVRDALSRDPAERAASAARWQALMERADVSAGGDFRDDLQRVLSDAVDRLEALHDEVLPDEPRQDRPRQA